jgi:HlyD family secretion protein
MAKPSGLRKWIRRVLIVLAVLAVVGLIVVAWIPNPVEVEVAEVTRGPLVVTVNEDGRTRVKDRYLVSAPITGNLARLDLEAGDAIEEGQVLARLVPLPPPLLDSRTRAEAKARVDAAMAARRQSQAAVNRARYQRDFAKQESERALAVVNRSAPLPSCSKEGWRGATRTEPCPPIAGARRTSTPPTSAPAWPSTS